MAIIVGIAVYFFASSIQSNAQVQTIAEGQVVVAVTEIPANTLITADMVKLTKLPSVGVNQYAATDLSQVIGTIAKYPLLPDEQVLSPQLVEKGKENDTLSLMLEDGKRAISIGVDDMSGVSGYITKGDYVDVVATLMADEVNDPNGKSKPISVCLVENLLVLQVGSKQSSTNTKESYTTVTLSATPEEALKINLAATNGKIRLILRPMLDNKIVDPDDYYNPKFVVKDILQDS